MRRAKRSHAVLLGVGLSILAYACSADKAGSAPGTGAQNGQSGAAGKLGNGGGAGLSLSVPDASGGGTLDPDAACGIGSADATLRPVSILVMFDRSNSMVRPASVDPVTTLNRWQTATGALKTFLADPGTAGLGLALRFFPDDRPAAGCTMEGCNSAACATPLVEAGMLSAAPAPADDHEARLLAAIDSSTPQLPMGSMATGGTPISAALDGALSWAAAHQLDHPDGRTVVLLVTDGAPSGCDERIAAITGLAENALAMSGVATYAIGLADSAGEGVHEEDMDAIAEAGGTERAYFVKDGPGAANELLSTLTAVHRQALPCDFPMPEATSKGQEIDVNLVNVTYTSGSGSDSLFTRVPNADTCSQSLSWYYDDETAPTRVLLCPAACELVASDPGAHFEILVGCAPIFAPPPK
jgi:hypothetical protein